MSNAKRLAQDHWDWLENLLGTVYRDAFEHGHKHGYEVRQLEENMKVAYVMLCDNCGKKIDNGIIKNEKRFCNENCSREYAQ